jgi:chromosome segregation ATPase
MSAEALMDRALTAEARVAELEAELKHYRTLDSDRDHWFEKARELEAELAKVKEQWEFAAKAQLERSEKAEAEVEKLRARNGCAECQAAVVHFRDELKDSRNIRRAWQNRAEEAEAKLAEARHGAKDNAAYAGRLSADVAHYKAKLAEVENALRTICEFTQEHGDWSLLPAGKVAAKVHNIARAALASLEEDVGA